MWSTHDYYFEQYVYIVYMFFYSSRTFHMHRLFVLLPYNMLVRPRVWIIEIGCKKFVWNAAASGVYPPFSKRMRIQCAII